MHRTISVALSSSLGPGWEVWRASCYLTLKLANLVQSNLAGFLHRGVRIFFGFEKKQQIIAMAKS